MTIRNINAEGEAVLKQYEGRILFAYDDFDPPNARRRIKTGDKVRGTLTIGYGHTGPDVKPGMTISEERALDLLRADLDIFEAAVTRAVTVPLTDNQYAALVVFGFNIGETAFKKSTLLKKLNAGDYDAVPGELMKWTKSKGKKLAGLVNRRSAEAGLWAKGAFVQSSGSPVQKEAPAVLTPETIAVGTSILTGAGSSLFSGTGPVQYALGAVMVIAAISAAFLFVRKRMAS